MPAGAVTCKSRAVQRKHEEATKEPTVKVRPSESRRGSVLTMRTDKPGLATWLHQRRNTGFKSGIVALTAT